MDVAQATTSANDARRPSAKPVQGEAFAMGARRRFDAPPIQVSFPQEDYFSQGFGSVPAQRRTSVSSAVYYAMGGAAVERFVAQTFNPPDSELVEPFSFESVKTSPASGIKLAIGLLGIAGYQLGGVLLVDNLYQVSGPPGVAPGVGAPRIGPDGHLSYSPPPVWIGAVVFGVGITLGITSSVLFLADGLRIAGNRKKAFAYVSMHLTGIVLISMSKFIVTWRKQHISRDNFIALSLPGGIGRGLHFITIPRSFSNSEVTRGDVARLSFAQRQLMSEGLRLVAAVFLGLWAASWSVVDYDPLAREAYSILASLTLNLSAALPATNLRRADIYRRSQVSLLSPQLNSFRLGQPSPVSPPTVTRPPMFSRISERSEYNIPPKELAAASAPI